MQIALLVIDSGGIGDAPDARAYGDGGADTIGHAASFVGGLDLPTLGNRLGLARLTKIPGTATDRLEGIATRMHPQAKGKDTLAGHWEMMGLWVKEPFRTYPEAFPSDVRQAFETAIKRPVLGNEVASGTEIIARLGARHMETGWPILYTSADSVMQIAAHEAIVPLDELYAWCQIARRQMQGPNRVGRIIARPFVGEPGAFVRTANRRDFAVAPEGPIEVEALQRAGVDTLAIGKIGDIFSEQGFDAHWKTESNQDGLERTREALMAATGPQHRFVFTNLVDFDSKFGHRRDAAGYAEALKSLDGFLPRILEVLNPEDQLWITADHGCDPTYRGTDHTREDVPWLLWGKRLKPQVLPPRQTLSDIAATLALLFGVPTVGPGRPVIEAEG